MNTTLDQVIAANEELVLAIEQMNIDVRPMRIGNVSLALEEAQEDAANQSKATVLEKLKAFARKVLEWFRNFFGKKKEQQKETPLFDQEKFKKDMDAMFKETQEHVRKKAEQAGAQWAKDVEGLRERVKRAQENAAARNAAKPAPAQPDPAKPGVPPEANALWKKHIEPNLTEFIRQQVRPKCGLITAFAKGAKISHDSVRFADITAPVREFDNQIYKLVEDIQILTNQVTRNLANGERVEEALRDIQESQDEIKKYTQIVLDLGKVEPVAPQIDDVSINTVYRVAYDLSGKMPRSGIVQSQVVIERALENLNKAIEDIRHQDGMSNSDALRSLQSMLAEVIVPTASLVARAVDVVNKVFYSFQEIGSTIKETAMAPNKMPQYSALVADIAKQLGIQESEATELAANVCKANGYGYLYPNS